MRIAVDASRICDRFGGHGAGVEHYTWSIIFSLLRLPTEHHFFVFVPANFPRFLERELTLGVANVRLLRMSKGFRFISRHLWLPWRARWHRPDVWFSPTCELPLTLKTPSVVTVHDLAIFEHAEWFPESTMQHFSMNYTVPKNLAKAKSIVAVSQATKVQMKRIFPWAVEKTEVIYEGVRPPENPENLSEMMSGRFDMTDDYVLFLGTLEPRKNIVNALRAFDLFLEQKPEQGQVKQG